jgi:signal transduction histidine kinase/HD-like signal output (HDOD) protein
VAQILEACHDPAATPAALAEIALQDVALCAKIINAAVKTCPDSLDPATPISSAVAGLSPPIVKSLVLHSARSLIDSRFTAREAKFLRDLWFFSRVGGSIARSVAESVSYPAPEEAQVTAMLMNIGTLALFSRDPEKYLQNIDTPAGGEEVRATEQARFGVDHLQLAEALVSGWKLTSFMADAIRFMHLDVEKSREATPLVRIAQLARRICRSPLSLDAGSVRLAEQLFNLTEAETAALFQRAERQYGPSSPLGGRQEESLQELNEAGRHLTAVVFSLLDQEATRSQLSGTDGVSSARQLYLHNSAALEAVFFILDQQRNQLVGLPSAAQSRLVTGLATSLGAGNLLAEALKGDKLRHSFAGESELAIFDQQLIRVCRGKGIACLPLWADDRLVGGVVLGLDSAGAVESLNTPTVLALNRTVARSLTTVAAAAAGGSTAGRRDGELPRLAHEIANPLAIINNYLPVLGEMVAGTGHAGILSAIASQVDRIDDILKYYAAGPDAPKQSTRPVAVDAAILAVVESLRPTHFGPKRIEVVIDFDPTVGTVATNPVLVKQILVNLLTNSTEALADEGRVVIRTREQITSDGRSYVVIAVEDNGPGIDKRIIGSLFSPIVSTKGARHAGLGLSIVKGMADEIGATISCHSTSNSGATFSLMIPRDASIGKQT